MEFQEDNSLLPLPVFSGTRPASRQSDTFTEFETTLPASDPTTPPPSQEVTSSSCKANMWDTIAEAGVQAWQVLSALLRTDDGPLSTGSRRVPVCGGAV